MNRVSHINKALPQKEVIQYTVRGVDTDVDGRLRELAKRQGKSFNQIALEALSRHAGFLEGVRHSDLDWFFGAWNGGGPHLDSDSASDAAFERMQEVFGRTEPQEQGE